MFIEKIVKVKFIFLLSSFFIANISMSQWQQDFRLTNNFGGSYGSFNNVKNIVISGNFVHVIWYDSRDINLEIYYKRSTDGGTNWETDKRLTNDANISYYPSVTAAGSVVHTVWMESRDGNFEIYYKRSADDGFSWGPDTRLTTNSAVSQYPSVSVSGSIVHVAWMDNRDGNYEIYYKRSTDGGISWGTDTRLTNNTGISFNPSVTISSSSVHIGWWDDRNGNEEIYYKRSTDGGISWGTDTRLTSNSASSYRACISASSSFINVVWMDNRDGNYEIYYKRSTNDGLNWEVDTRLTIDSASSNSPSISVSGSVVHVVWNDIRDGNFEIYYKRSTDEGMSWENDTRLTDNSAPSEFSSLSVYSSVVHVVWRDNRDGNFEIYYKRNPAGNPIVLNIKAIPEGFYYLPGDYLNSKDTIRAYLRSIVSPYIIVDSAKAKIDSLTFTGSFYFPGAISGTYYIHLKHRNSIETWSKSGGQSFTHDSTINYNFTSSVSQAFGNNLTLIGNRYCIYSGDVNQDGIVDAADAGMIDNDAFYFAAGYINTDVTGDKIVDANDAAIVDNNSYFFIGKITP